MQLLDRWDVQAVHLQTFSYFCRNFGLTAFSPPPPPPSFSDPQDENKIGIDGIQQFCDDLSLDPASITVLVVAWKFRAATQCEFTKKEFLDGMTELG